MSEPTERIHYAKVRIESLEPRSMEYFKALAPSPFFKPQGLWYSAPVDGDGWEEWCRSEEFGLGSLTHRHTLEVDLARMLVIRDAAGLDKFTKRYSLDKTRARREFSIQWLLVFDDYAGIEIAPYQWSRRNELLWYYPWDCASGCVWDLSAIKRWEPQS